MRWCFRENARPSPPAASIHMLRAGGAAAPRVWPPSGRLQEQARRGLSLALPSAPPDRVFQPYYTAVNAMDRPEDGAAAIGVGAPHAVGRQDILRQPSQPHDPVGAPRPCWRSAAARPSGMQLATTSPERRDLTHSSAPSPSYASTLPQPTVAAQMLAEAANLQDQIEGGCWPCRQ